MGVAKLKKVELYYHKSVKDDVTKILQRSGACQITLLCWLPAGLRM